MISTRTLGTSEKKKRPKIPSTAPNAPAVAALPEYARQHVCGDYNHESCLRNRRMEGRELKEDGARKRGARGEVWTTYNLAARGKVTPWKFGKIL